tara:strand:- start:7031 stop:7639 length:609 start_codon:yes stop_codon:yes gene_type:complete
MSTCVISTANAGIIIGDKEWMQVTDTSNFSWNDFDAIFDTASGQCDITGCLLGGTIDLTGYTWADNSSVNDLLISYSLTGFSSLTGNNYVPYGTDSLDAMLSDFAPTNSSLTWINLIGRTRNQTATTSYGDVVRVASPKSLTGIDRAYIDTNRNWINPVALRSSQAGGWLYKAAAVPEPSSVAIFALGIMGLASRRFKKKFK